MGTVKEDVALIAQRKGQYIRVQGFGIADGLKIKKTKYQFHQIIDYDPGTRSLILRRYRCKRFSYLPYHNQEQKYEIIDRKEYKSLEVY